VSGRRDDERSDAGEYLRVRCEPENLSLSVRDLGEGRRTCILLHGFGEGSYVWDAFISDIASAARLIAIDFRGHGDSSWDPQARYTVLRHVMDVLQVIETLRLDRCVLVGHSLGGAVALRVAARRPQVLESVMVIDYGPRLNPAGAERVRLDFRDSLRNWGSVDEYARWLQERRPFADAAILSRMAQRSLCLDPRGGWRLKADPALCSDAVWTGFESAEAWEMLKLISVPVTVVRGMGSAVLSANVLGQMMRVLPDGRAVTVANAGHAVMSDNPREFTQVLRSFLSV